MKRRIAAVGAITVTLLASACSGTTPVVSNGSVSACYRAIPVGRTAVRDSKARLIGVHRIPADVVRSQLPAAARAELAAENDTSVCAMSFKGSFGAGQVNMASPQQHGDYALVLVSSRKLHLIGAVVLDHLPKAFGGRTI